MRPVTEIVEQIIAQLSLTMCSTGAADSSLLTLLECYVAARSTLAFDALKEEEEI
jgi:hypothetical protein